MYEVASIPAFKDNYIHCLIHGNLAWIVDPGDAQPVFHFLQERNLIPAALLLTHHHQDHTGGVSTLRARFPTVAIAASHLAQPQPTIPVREGKQEIAGLLFQIFEIPGHTLDHVAYAIDDILFCGDTLFCGGCGRVFEGTHAQMHASLMRLRQLPAHTKVYCAHEYTLANLRFAAAIEPKNEALRQRLHTVEKLRAQGTPTVPSTMHEEMATNPFLRTDHPELRQALDGLSAHGDWQEQAQPNAQQTFQILRQRKDVF